MPNWEVNISVDGPRHTCTVYELLVCEQIGQR